MDNLKNIFSNSKAKSKKSRSNQNFEEIKDIPGELRNRDVYVDQQFERGDIEKPRSNTSNIVISIIAGFLAFLFSLFILGLISYLIGGFNSNFRGKKSDLSNEEARRSSYSEKNSSDRFNGKDLNFDDTVDVKGKASRYDVEVDGDLGDKPSFDYKGGYNRGKIYYEEETVIDPMTGMNTKYFQVDENGNRVSDKAYDMISEIPVPSWYEELHPEIAKGKGPNANVNINKNQGDLDVDIKGREGSKSDANLDGSEASGRNNQGLSDKDLRNSDLADKGVMHHVTHPTIKRFLLSLIIGLAVGGTLYEYLYRILKAENAMTETTDINPYKNDQHIALPQELQRQLDWFPDVGAKSSAQPSTLMSHMHLENKGIKPVIVPMRYKEDVIDEDGDILHYKSEVIYNDNGKMQAKKMPLFDTKFSDALFETSGADRKYWIRYDTTKIPYNPGNKNIEKLKGYDTVSDLINRDWDLPYYEVQRPAGAYLVDTAPVI